MSSLVSAACAAALLGASAAGRVPLLLVLAVVQLALIVGWCRRAGMARLALAAGVSVALAGAIAGDIALLSVHEHIDIRVLAGVFAAVVGAAFVVQLARRDGRAQLVGALSATIATAALAIAGAVFLDVRAGRGGIDVVAIALVAVGVGLLPVQHRVPLWIALPVGTAAGIGVGIAVAARSTAVGLGSGCAVAAVSVAVALLARVGIGEVADAATAARRVRVEPVTSTLPVLVVAPAVLVVASIMVG